MTGVQVLKQKVWYVGHMTWQRQQLAGAELKHWTERVMRYKFLCLISVRFFCFSSKFGTPSVIKKSTLSVDRGETTLSPFRARP